LKHGVFYMSSDKGPKLPGRGRLFLLILLIAFGVAACRAQVDIPENTLVIGVLSDIQSWNPYLSDTKFTENILALVYPSLMVEDVDYRQHPPSFRPALATSWESSKDGLSLVFHLNPDARWEDGQPVDADDVLYSFHAQRSKEVGWYGSYTKDYILSVEALDSHTVRYVFDHAYPYQLMDANEGLILPAHLWKDIPFASWSSVKWLEKVVAGGAFKPVFHHPRQDIGLEKNTAYTLGKVAEISRVIWRIIPEQSALMTQLLAGELDFVDSVPPDRAKLIEKDPRYRIYSHLDRGYTHICWNLRRPILSDRRVRTALSLAINRQNLIKNVYHGYAEYSRGPILSTMWAFDQSLEKPEFDPVKARSLLKECGWKDSDSDGILEREGEDFEIEILCNAENRMRQDISLLIANDLKAIGVKVIPRSIEWGSFLSRLREGEFDGAINRWVEPTQIDLEDLWHSAAEGEMSSNFGAYSNPEVDRLIDEVAGESDFSKQAPLYHRIQRMIVRDQPYAFLVEGKRLNAISRRISGAVLNDATPYFNLEEWSIKQESR